MNEAKFCIENDKIFVTLPLTSPTGKVRIKERNSFYEYGIPVAVRQTPLSLKHYVEWQIGYDILNSIENRTRTMLQNYPFVNYKGESKLPYELAEILFYSCEKKLVDKKDIIMTYNEILSTEKTIDIMEEMQITRTNPMETKINGIDFYKMKISYPLLVHRFGKYDIYAEIIIKEKQRAVGIQPMLYVCLPITALQFEHNALERTLESKECASWNIGKEEAKLSLELFRIFGMLSKKHKYDVAAILKTLFNL